MKISEYISIETMEFFQQLILIDGWIPIQFHIRSFVIHLIKSKSTPQKINQSVYKTKVKNAYKINVNKFPSAYS